MKYSYILWIGLVLLASCRELVEDSFPEFHPTPTVNSILVSDSIIKVHLSLAQGLSDQPLQVIKDAQVSLFQNEQYIEDLIYHENGEYFSTCIAKAGNSYACIIEIPGHYPIQCSTYLPVPELILNIDHIDIAGVDEEGRDYPAVQISFSNNQSKVQHYEGIIHTIKYGYEYISGIIFIEDPVLLHEGIPLVLFGNERIMDSVYSMRINYTTNSVGIEGMNLYPLIFEFRTVHPDYYLFRKQLHFYKLGRYPEGSGFSLASADLYSNIEGAYGIFTGYSSVRSDTIFPNTWIE